MTHSKIQVEDEESRLAIRFLRKRTKKFNWGHHKSSPKDDEIEKQDEKLKGLEIEHLTEAVNSKLEITTSHPEVQVEDEESRLAIRFLCKRTKKFNWGHHDDNVEQNELPKISKTQKLNNNILLKIKETKQSRLLLKISNFNFLFSKIISHEKKNVLTNMPDITIPCEYCHRNFFNSKVYSIHLEKKHSIVTKEIITI